jgi:hypothetical protein
VAAPIPLEAPVIRTTLLFNPDMDTSKLVERVNPRQAKHIGGIRRPINRYDCDEALSRVG